MNTNTSDDHEYQVLIFPEPVRVISRNLVKFGLNIQLPNWSSPIHLKIILTAVPVPPVPNSPMISLGMRSSDATSGDGYKPFPPVPGVASRNLSGNSGRF